jgi:predicted outer membrane protein
MRARFAVMAMLAALVAALSAGSALAFPPHPGTLTQQDRHFLSTAAEENCFEIAAANFALQHWQSPGVHALAGRLATDHARALGQLQGVATGMRIQLTAQIAPVEQFMLSEFAASAQAGKASVPEVAATHRGVVIGTGPFAKGSLAARCAGLAPRLTPAAAVLRKAKGAAVQPLAAGVPAPLRFDRMYATFQQALFKRAVADYSSQLHSGPDPLLSSWAGAALPMLRAHLRLATTAVIATAKMR